jgi:uncharacterized protein YjbI with pentapeptide repeats
VVLDGYAGSWFIGDSSTPGIITAMAEDKGTSVPEQGKEPTGSAHIPREVVVVLLASLIASAIAVLILAPHLHIPGDIDDRAVQWGLRTAAGLVAIGAIWRLIRLGYDYQWTGLGDAEFRPKQKDAEFRPKKTLWDWLQLLIVPIVLSLITVAFTWQQNARQQEAEERRAKVDRQIEEHRADDAALQAYLDQIGTLLIKRDLRYSTEDNATEESKEARTLARARTLTVLARLDPTRKTEVMRFLIEAKLVQRIRTGPPAISITGTENSRAPVISLSGADLDHTDMRAADLKGAYLDQTDLYRADLYNADLDDAALSEADLRYANLSLAYLRYNASLNHADLRHANLRAANLRYAELPFADLRGANLGDADLYEADLENADLRGTFKYNNEGTRQLITNEELEQQSAYLNDATMPNGQKYEDWLKDKEGPGEDE